MRIFLSAQYRRRAEIRHYAEELIALGYEVTSRWLFDEHGNDNDLMISGTLDPVLGNMYAAIDEESTMIAECIIAFTEKPRSGSSGGRHVEFGIARGAWLATGIPRRMIVVGPKENVFHWRDHVECYPTWEEAKQALSLAPDSAANI